MASRSSIPRHGLLLACSQVVVLHVAVSLCYGQVETLDEVIEGANAARGVVVTAVAEYRLTKTTSSKISPEQVQAIIDSNIAAVRSQWNPPAGLAASIADSLLQADTETRRLSLLQVLTSRTTIEDRQLTYDEGAVADGDARRYRYRLEVANLLPGPRNGPTAKYLGWTYTKTIVYDGRYQYLIKKTQFEDRTQIDVLRTERNGLSSLEQPSAWARPSIRLRRESCEEVAVDVSEQTAKARVVKVTDGCDQDASCEEYTKLWVRPDLGFTVEREERWSQGQLRSVKTYENMRQDRSGIWYPMVIEQSFYGGEGSGQEPRDHVRLEVLAVELNARLPEQSFDIDLPEDAILIDVDQQPPRLYRNGVLLGP
jgi:hypothetical protein